MSAGRAPVARALTAVVIDLLFVVGVLLLFALLGLVARGAERL